MSAAIFGAMGMGALAMYGEKRQQKKLADLASDQRIAEMLGAKSKYAATESSINLMKANAREVTANAIQETLRAGAAQNQKVRDEVQKVSSSVSAKSEGLTSGRSQGRQMIEVAVTGNKVLNESKSETASMINNLTDAQDSRTNELNNSLLSSWQEMATILSTPSNAYEGDKFKMGMAGLQGAAQGASFGSAIGGK